MTPASTSRPGGRNTSAASSAGPSSMAYRTSTASPPRRHPERHLLGPSGRPAPPPAGPPEAQRGARPGPSREIPPPRLDPGPLVSGEHDTRLVVLNAEGAAHPDRDVEVPAKHFAVDVTAVPDVPVTGLAPEICA